MGPIKNGQPMYEWEPRVGSVPRSQWKRVLGCEKKGGSYCAEGQHSVSMKYRNEAPRAAWLELAGAVLRRVPSAGDLEGGTK